MSKYVDVACIMQVIGCVYNNPRILDQTDKYIITEQDFPDKFHKIIFGAIYKIYELGASQITLKNILDFLAERPKSEAIFTKEKGEEWLQQASENATSTAFDYYYNRMKKMSLLRAFDDNGIDVSHLYDPDNIFDTKKKQQQEEWLDNNSLDFIASKISDRLDEIVSQYVNNTFGEVQKPSDKAKELRERLKQRPDVGVPLYGSLINTVTRGARLRKLYLGSAPSGYGKAIPNYTLIPTPNGWREVGDIKAGDYLFGRDGKPTRVIQVHPQPTKKEIYNVHFSDGRVAECCEDHLWKYYDKFNKEHIESVKEILSKVDNLQEKFKTADGEYRFKIDINFPVEYQSKNYNISPYDIGIAISSNSKEEYIPNEYLIGSIDQRCELLQGLLDTNGTVDSEGRINFTTVSYNLKNNIVDLCHSLGMITTVNEMSSYYNILVQAKDNKLSIVNIYPTGKYTEMTCFTVDNDEHLFLMNDYIVTHNTRSMISHVCNIGCNEIYHENFGWIKNGTAEPVLYITTEQELEEIQTMMWSFLSAVNEDHILNNTYVGDEEQRVDKAIEILEKSNIYIVELPDFSLRDVENVIKQNIREHDIKYVFHDYIMTSLKILEEISGRTGGVKLREDNILFMLSRRLKDIANEYGVFVFSSTQLNGEWKEAEIPDQNLLRGAKSIADSIDLGYHILPVTQKDLDALEIILSSNTFAKPNTKMSFYKNRRGRYKGVYLWCDAQYGICRFNPMFATTWNYEIIPMEDLIIETEEAGAF